MFGLRQFRSERRLSYLIFRIDYSGEAVWIDRDAAQSEEGRGALAELGLKAELLLDTVPGLNPGARVPAPGEKFAAVGMDWQAFAVPGAPGLGLIVEPEPGSRLILAGHAFEAGGEAPLGGIAALEGLPDATPVFPGRESRELLFSTLGAERRGGELLAGGAALAAEKFRAKLAHPRPSEAFIDVREAAEFAAERIAGTRCLPISELALHLAELARYERIYLTDLSGRRSVAAARSLARAGISSVVTVVGGLQAWKNAGLPTEGA